MDRGTRARLVTLSKTTNIQTLEEEKVTIQGMPFHRQEVLLDMPGRPDVRVHETIAPGIVMASARPPSSAAYLALLLMSVTWGHPSTIYEDQLADTEYADVTGVWMMGELESGEAVVQHLLEHGERGYDWEPLDESEWLEKARPALEAQG